MSLNAVIPRLIWQGSGSTSSISMAVGGLPITFRSNSYIRVKQYDSDTGLVTLLAEGTDYSISGGPVLPGSTTPATLTRLAGNLASTKKWAIYRAQPIAQDLDITQGGAFSSADIEAAEDRSREIEQELSDRLDRAIVADECGIEASAHGARVTDAADAVEDDDLATLGQLTTLVAGLQAGASTVIDYQTLAAFQAANISGAITSVWVRGYASGGDGGAAQYKRISTPSTPYAWHKQTADGGWWQIVASVFGIQTKAFGAKHDATGNWYDPSSWTGTDDTAAIQACIDFTIYVGKCRCILSPGTALVSNTIHLCYGDGFRTVHFEGHGRCYLGSANFPGSALFSTVTDRPAINIQGTRAPKVRGFDLVGINAKQLYDHNLATNSNDLDDTDGANWVSASLGANADSRDAPHAGICCDGFTGTQPTTHYPSVSYPSYAASSTQYGKDRSSAIVIEEVGITGFVVGIVTDPNRNADGNDEFLKVHKSQIEYCKYGVSISHGQSRNVELTGVEMAVIFKGLTGNTHGAQIGKFNGTISNLSVGQIMHVFDLGGSPYFGPLKIHHCYGELVWRLGDVTFGSSNETGLGFDSGNWNFDLQTEARGFPATVMKTGAGQPGSVRFDNCQFTGANVLAFGIPGSGQNFAFRDCASNSNPEDDYEDEYQWLAHDGTCGGIVTGLGYDTPQRSQDIKFRHLAIADGSAQARRLNDGHWQSQRSLPIPIHARTASHANDQSGELLCVPQRVTALAKTGDFTSLTLTDRTLAGTFTSRSAYQYGQYGPLPGDVLQDSETGMVFFVSSRSGSDFEAVAMTNYKSDGAGGYDTLEAFSTSVGYLWCAVTRLFMPSYPLLGDVSLGSAEITSCGADNGSSSFISTEIAADDYLRIDYYKDRYFSEADSLVTAVSGTSITLNAAAQRDAPRKHLAFWARKPPA